MQKLEVLISQANCVENKYASNKRKEQPVKNTQEPAVAVKKTVTREESLRQMTQKRLIMMFTALTKAHADSEMKQPTQCTLTKNIGITTHGKEN